MIRFQPVLKTIGLILLLLCNAGVLSRASCTNSIARVWDEEILSAIDKRPVRIEDIEVGKINLAGNAQANLEKHGGPDKAIYAYPTDNWPWWEKEHHFACRPGVFGENLTLAG